MRRVEDLRLLVMRQQQELLIPHPQRWSSHPIAVERLQRVRRRLQAAARQTEAAAAKLGVSVGLPAAAACSSSSSEGMIAKSVEASFCGAGNPAAAAEGQSAVSARAPKEQRQQEHRQ